MKRRIPYLRPARSIAPALIAAAAFVCWIAPRTAPADVRYTMAMSMGDSSSGNSSNASMTPMMRRTIMVKDNQEREEMTMDMGPMHQDNVTLTLCDKRQIVQLSPTLKLYTVQSMDQAVSLGGMTTMSMGPQRGGPPQIGAKSGTGKVVSTISVQDMGTEKILDLDTHHYMMNTQTQMSGCAGDGNTSTKIEMWVAPIKAGLDCPEMYSPSRSVTTESGCQMTYQQNGDLDTFRGVYGGMPVRMKLYQGDKVMMVMDMREYSTAALDQSLFDIPADYKEVSRADFDKAQQQAMMDSMRNGFPGPNNGQNAQNTTSAGDNSSDQNAQNGTQNNNQSNDQNNNQNNDQNNDNQNNTNQSNTNQNKKHGGFHLPNLPF